MFHPVGLYRACFGSVTFCWVLWGSVGFYPAYLVPESLPVQGNEDHGGVSEEALAVEGQVLLLPGHVQHMSAAGQHIHTQIIKHERTPS